MTYDQAQSPRLGQKLSPENPGVQIRAVNTLPEVAYRGMLVYAADIDCLSVYDGTAWQTPGSGSQQIFTGPTEPAADHEGDLWYNTTNSGMYVWLDGDWVPVVDPQYEALELQVSANMADISDLQSDIEGVTTTYYDTVAPVSPNTGDLWFNETTNRLYRWSGTTWEEITNQDAINAVAAADLAQTTADGKIDTYHSNSPPTVDAEGNPLGAEDDGDLWFDLDDGHRLYRWSGSAWVDVQDAQIAAQASIISGINGDITVIQGQIDQKATTYFQTTQPWANGLTTHDADFNDVWYKTTDSTTWIWKSTRTWVQFVDPDIQQALDDAHLAQSTADGKINHYVATTRPWPDGDTTHDLDVGDIWTNTSSGNVDYYWKVSGGRAWTILPKGYGAVSSGAVDNSTITGSIVRTAASGNRMQMRADVSGGVLEGYSGVSGETAPFSLNPETGSYGPVVTLESGASTSYPSTSKITMYSMSAAAGAGQIIFSGAAIFQNGMDVSGQSDFHSTINAATANATFQKVTAQAFLGPGALPIGGLCPYGGNTAPYGFLVCDGSSVSTTTYADLFAAIGYNFGGVGGSFQLPDLRDRSVYGVGSSWGMNTNDGFALGSRTRTLDHLHPIPSQSDHTHGITTSSDHNHSLTAASMGTASNTTTGGGADRLTSGSTHNHGGSTGDAGGHAHGGSTAGDGFHNHGGNTSSTGPVVRGVGLYWLIRCY